MAFYILQLDDVSRLRTLLALGNLERDALLLFQAPEALGLNGGVMNEDIVPTIVRGNEAVPLLGVEPLDGAFTCGHATFL